MTRRRLPAIVGAVLLVACGNELGPVDPTGRWNVAAYYTGGTSRCWVEATLEFPEDLASGLSSYQEQRVNCTDAGTSFTIPPRTYPLLLSIADTSIIFVPEPNLDSGNPSCAALKFVGTMGREHMAGTVHTMPWNCSTYLLMQGTWRASRVEN